MSAVAALLPVVTALHLGSLHGSEKVLVLVLAFGPFVVLALAMRVAQRRARREDGEAGDGDDGGRRDLSARPPAT